MVTVESAPRPAGAASATVARRGCPEHGNDDGCVLHHSRREPAYIGQSVHRRRHCPPEHRRGTEPHQLCSRRCLHGRGGHGRRVRSSGTKRRPCNACRTACSSRVGRTATTGAGAGPARRRAAAVGHDLREQEDERAEGERRSTPPSSRCLGWHRESSATRTATIPAGPAEDPCDGTRRSLTVGRGSNREHGLGAPARVPPVTGRGSPRPSQRSDPLVRAVGELLTLPDRRPLFTRSTSAAQAAKASARCGDDTAAASATSPMPSAPTRCSTADADLVGGRRRSSGRLGDDVSRARVPFVVECRDALASSWSRTTPAKVTTAPSPVGRDGSGDLVHRDHPVHDVGHDDTVAAHDALGGAWPRRAAGPARGRASRPAPRSPSATPPRDPAGSRRRCGHRRCRDPAGQQRGRSAPASPRRRISSVMPGSSRSIRVRRPRACGRSGSRPYRPW